MRTYESEAGEQYTYICSVHDDIRDWAEQIEILSQKIMDVVAVAKDMGINMEDYLMRRKTTVEEQEDEIKELKKEIKKLKASAKRKAKKAEGK